MRIAFVITGVETGGAEMMLLKVVSRLHRDRYDPFVVSLKEGGEMAEQVGGNGIGVCGIHGRVGSVSRAVARRFGGAVEEALEPPDISVKIEALVRDPAARLAQRPPRSPRPRLSLPRPRRSLYRLNPSSTLPIVMAACPGATILSTRLMLPA